MARGAFPRAREAKTHRAVLSERPRRHGERAAWTEERVAAARRKRSAASRRVAGRKVRTRALWGTFSEIAARPARPRNRLLDDLARLADEELGGRVELPRMPRRYTARRIGVRERDRGG